jgi:exodeoxyribonuclease-1
LRDKSRVLDQLDIVSKKPVLHVSSMYPAAHGALALVAPLTRHPTDKNGVIVFDLRQDPAQWLHLDVETLRRRLFTRQEELAEGETRIALKVLHVNRCPVIAPASLLDEATAARLAIDPVQARLHWQRLLDAPEAIMRVASAFDRPLDDAEVAAADPDFMIYSGGFLAADDKRTLAQVRAASPAELALWRPGFRDPRLDEMLFRYRARNFPASLTPAELGRWQAHCHATVLREPKVPGPGVSWTQFAAELAQLRADPGNAGHLQLLEELAQYGRDLLPPELRGPSLP